MIKLSRRLEAVLSEVSGDSCADIGCDHGKLIVSALIHNRVRIGYAVDISKSSLEKAKLLGREENVSSRLNLICGDGALLLPEKVSVAVIAGMGATETVHILSQGDFAEKYVLSPHQDAQILRRYLKDNGYYAEKDYYVFDKKYYPIIVATKGVTNYTDKEMFFGKNTPKTDIYDEFVAKRKTVLDKLYETLGEKLGKETLSEKEEADQCCKETPLK